MLLLCVLYIWSTITFTDCHCFLINFIGVFNSSKTTGSMSDADLTDDGGEGRVGVLDYFHTQSDAITTTTHKFGKLSQEVGRTSEDDCLNTLVCYLY